MNKISIIIMMLLLLTGCSIFDKQQLFDRGVLIHRQDGTVYKADSYEINQLTATEDSLKQIVRVQQTELDSLNAYIGIQDSLIEVLQMALIEADQRIAIKQGFQIPDSIVFAGVTLDLTNERLANKLKKAYDSELKDAYNYIPRSGRYFAYFDSVFTQYGVPQDAKYLAIAESRLSYLAQSPVGATGIWQFMKPTAKEYGMIVDEFIDQRRDVFLSTEAAARYLLFNYNYLKRKDVDDWLLAFCGYNAGIGNVEKVIKQQGGKTFSDLIMGVDETDRYVWKAVALKMIFENEEEIFNKKFLTQIPIEEEIRCVELSINGYYEIDEWAQAQGTFVSRVWELNPWIKTYRRSREKYSAVLDVVLPPGKYVICLPVESEPDEATVARIEQEFQKKNSGYFEFYTVKKGDNLYNLSRKFHTSVSKLKSINGLSSDIIKPGQELRIFGKEKNNEYVVKKGDYINKIASNLGVSASHLMKTNNLKKKSDGTCIIYPGQKLYY
ncbi:MAG: LysM peptidoglycan-binding domain-containing protein [Candidatus Cloacimonetes bacterium]|nr:LysM peptidoglycan-binding domain-containing protein [Candidatus Cloacimonadota bacterium]